MKAQGDCALTNVSLVLSFAPARHRLTRRVIPELICGDLPTDMLISHGWVVLISAAVMKSWSGGGASGHTVHVDPKW